MNRLDTPAAPDPSSEPGASAADSTTSAPHARSAPPARSAGSPLKKPVFWNFGGLFFFYFAIWQLAFTFLSRWLEVEAGMSHGNIGLLNSVDRKSVV